MVRKEIFANFGAFGVSWLRYFSISKKLTVIRIFGWDVTFFTARKSIEVHRMI